MLPGASRDAKSGAVERWRQAWRVSLLDLLTISDLAAELKWREGIYVAIGEANIKAALHNAEAVSIAALQKLVRCNVLRVPCTWSGRQRTSQRGPWLSLSLAYCLASRCLLAAASPHFYTP